MAWRVESSATPGCQISPTDDLVGGLGPAGLVVEPGAAAFDIHAPLCPFLAAAVGIPDPDHPARVFARDYKRTFAARLTDTARAAGATNPEQLGEQLALLLDGASARSRVLNTETLVTAATIAAVFVDKALPTAALPAGTGGTIQPGGGACGMRRRV